MPRQSVAAVLRFLLRALRWLVPCAFFTACERTPIPPAASQPSVNDLQFPVAVVFGRASVVKFTDSTDLGTMLVQNLITVDGPPALIDSHFVVYHLAKLRSTHNGLWLMANPTGVTPVTFELQRDPKTGIATARALLHARLDVQTWRTDLEQKRRELDSAQTLDAMLKIVQSPNQ
jgi:hypothetical protein